MRNRTVGINIRVTEQEKERIENFAKKCSLSISEYLRKLANGHAPNEIPSDNFYLVANDLQMMLMEYKKDDEMLAKLIRGTIDELYNIYINPQKEGDQNRHNKNMADT